MENKLFYTVNDNVTVKKLIDILSNYTDNEIYIANERGLIIEYKDDNRISLEGMSYFYYVDDFETLDDYKYVFDHSLIYSSITAKQLIELLSDSKDMKLSVIGSNQFIISISNNIITLDCLLCCSDCFNDSIKELEKEYLTVCEI